MRWDFETRWQVTCVVAGADDWQHSVESSERMASRWVSWCPVVPWSKHTHTSSETQMQSLQLLVFPDFRVLGHCCLSLSGFVQPLSSTVCSVWVLSHYLLLFNLPHVPLLLVLARPDLLKCPVFRGIEKGARARWSWSNFLRVCVSWKPTHSAAPNAYPETVCTANESFVVFTPALVARLRIRGYSIQQAGA